MTDQEGLTLNSTWSGLVYQKPNAPVSPHALVFRDVPIERVGSLSQSARNSQSESDDARLDHNLKSAYQQATLYRIVHEILLSYCGSRGQVSGSQMISIYERLLDWRKGLPPEEPDPDSEEEAPPHLLFLHIQYHVTVLQTLQPMLHTEHTDQTSRDVLTRAIVQHAQLAFNILVHYCEIYTYHHQSPVQLFCIVHVCDALVRYNSYHSAIPEVIEFALQSLEEASNGYPIARILRDSFRQAAYERHLSLPANIERRLDQKSPYLPHDVQNAFTRSTYQQPIDQLLPVLDASLGRDFAALLEKRHECDPDAMQTDGINRLDTMRIRSVVNQEDSF
ncbi:MAG: hypothetical protein Q9225_004012 [Loekoesia sp. 1 TL-2023]